MAVGKTGLGGLGAATYLGLGAPGLGSLAAGVGNLGGRVGGNVTGAGGQLLAGSTPNVTGNVNAAGVLPTGINDLYNPYGTVLDQISPGGVAAGMRVGRELDAKTNASILNTIGNAMYGQTERIAKSEMARQTAARQLATNMATAANMALASQAAGLNIAQNAGQSMGNAMSNRDQFRYF